MLSLGYGDGSFMKKLHFGVIVNNFLVFLGKIRENKTFVFGFLFIGEKEN